MRRRQLLTGVLGLTFQGCAWRKPVTQAQPLLRPTQLVFHVSSGSMLNPDLDGRPSPVLLKIFELRSVAAFDVGEYFTLSTNDGALGQDATAVESIMIGPSAAQVWRRQLKPDTRYIGAIAAFRDLESATWRSRVSVPQGRTTQLNVVLKKLVVTLTSQKDVSTD